MSERNNHLPRANCRPRDQRTKINAALYGLAWFDAHLWAYAEYYGLETLLSENLQPGYGSVGIVDPLVAQR